MASRSLPQRPAPDQAFRSEARKLWSEMVRQRKRAEEATDRADSAAHELETMRAKAEKRFKRPVPGDALLLDVLDMIDVQKGDRWVWLGMRNNKALATIRLHASEQSVVRVLAIAFGVIEDDDFGVLYPRDGDTEDVNPWHRTLRESPRSIGNRKRFQFDAKVGTA